MEIVKHTHNYILHNSKTLCKPSSTMLLQTNSMAFREISDYIVPYPRQVCAIPQTCLGSRSPSSHAITYNKVFTLSSVWSIAKWLYSALFPQGIVYLLYFGHYSICFPMFFIGLWRNQRETWIIARHTEPAGKSDDLSFGRRCYVSQYNFDKPFTGTYDVVVDFTHKQKAPTWPSSYSGVVFWSVL